MLKSLVVQRFYAIHPKEEGIHSKICDLIAKRF